MKAKKSANARRDPAPRVPELLPKKNEVAPQARGKLATADLPSVVSRYLAGESMQTLAAENSVARQSLYEWMLAGIGDEAYGAAVTSVLVRRVNEADHALEDPSIEPDTARAQARARFARMDLERRRPALYGQKPVNLTINTTNVDQAVIVSASDLLETVAAKRHAAVLPLDPEGEDSVSGS